MILSLTRDIYWKKCNIPDKEVIFEKGTFKGIWKKAIDTQSILFSNSGPFQTPKGNISIKNTLVAPVIYHKKVISAIHLANKPSDYDEYDVKWMDIIVIYMAPILHARWENEKREKELEQESEIRKNLLDNLPCIALILKRGTREIVSSNKAARDVGALPGKTCFEICAQRDDNCPFCLAPDEPRRLEVEYRGKFYEGIWIPLKDDLYVHYIFDITERKTAEAAIRESEAWSRLITDNAPILIGYVDKDMRYRFVNKMYEQWFGKNKEQIIGKKDEDILDENAFKRSSPFIREALKGRSSKFEGQVKLPNGEIKYFHNHLVPNVRSDGTNDGYCVVVSDITKMKKSEDQIKASLREKEILLQEVHHRIKNNLLVISSLLRLQSNFSQDERIVDILKISQNRIKSMALIHEKLYRSQYLTKINLKKYIEALVNDIFCSFEPYSGKIKINVHALDFDLKVKQAPYLGLIINELVYNSLKYAFPGGKDRQIEISLRATKKGKIKLVVNDNGIGLPGDFNQLKTKTLGLHFVSLLVNDQLNGTIHVELKEELDIRSNYKSEK